MTDNLISLREAIFYGAAGDTITFDKSLVDCTITLCGNQLEVYQGITIDASSVGGITIDANGQSRVFYVNGGSTENPVELISLTITGGNSGEGGGIFSCLLGLNDFSTRCIMCQILPIPLKKRF